MLGKKRILSLTISGLLMSPLAAYATPKWECQVAANGGWQCTKDGHTVIDEAVTETIPVLPKTIIAKDPVAPQESIIPAVATPQITISPEPVVTQEVKQQTQPVMLNPSAAENIQPSSENRQPIRMTSPSAYVSPKTDINLAGSQTRMDQNITPARRVLDPNRPRIDRDLNWQTCGPMQNPANFNAAEVKEGDTQISADSAEFYRKTSLGIFAGNVEIQQTHQLIEANEVRFNQDDHQLFAKGDVYYERDGILLSGEDAEIDLITEAAKLSNAQFRMPSHRARGRASEAHIIDKTRTSFKNVTFTTCSPGNSDWLLSAKTLEIDSAVGIGTVEEGKLTFKGFPLFYIPRASFPLKNQRKSGFLLPSVGNSSKVGLDLRTPYYFNISPQFDATLTPRVTSKRGIMIGGEVRYLTDWHSGIMTAEYLPDDREITVGNSVRGAFSYIATGNINPDLTANIDINYVSDNSYLDDLGESLAVSSASHLERSASLLYQTDDYDLFAQVQDYQTIDNAITNTNTPYARLPQILFELEKADQVAGSTLHLNAEYVNFDHNTNIHGRRFDINPAISFPVRKSWGYMTPKLGIRHTAYDLKNPNGTSISPNRTIGILSLDSGLYLDRQTHWFGQSMTQTFEPRAYYLYSSKADQTALPNFDSAELDFSYDNLFRENRFSGADRIGDANQITLAMTSRFLSNASGHELFRASLGETFYFRDQSVQLPGNPVRKENESDIVAELAAQLNQNWSTKASVQWDPNSNNSQTQESAFSINYHHSNKKLLNLSYRQTDNLVEHTDMSARWPIAHNWNAVGRWNYSLRQNKTLESFAGLEYESCCWRVSAIARRHVTDSNTDANTSFFLQFELKGFTTFGDKIESFLEDGILGYENE